MGIGNAVEIGSKGREFWEPITPEKVNKVCVRRRSADDLSGWSSPGADAARIGDLNEDVRQKEGSANDAGLTIIEVNHNRDALDFACFDTSCCADSFKHLDRRREVPEGARDKDVLFADSGAAGSADGSGRLESNLVAPLAGQQSVESLNSASTPVFNSNIPSSNVDDQCIVSSFEAVHDKPTGPSIISTPSVTSTPMQIHEPKIGINQNKRPRQQKPKRKKHTPKVIREGKPRRTPKRKDLGSTTPLPKKKKQAREKIGNDSRPPTGDINEGALKDAITEKRIGQAFQPDVKSCRRHLDFGDGNVADQHCGNDSFAGLVQSTQDSYIGTGLVQSRRDSYIADQTSSPVLPPRKPVNRKSQCLNRIRRIGQNFPKKFKKKRTGRKERISAMEKMTYMLFVLCPRDFYVSYPRHLKKKRRHLKKKRNANRFESPVAVETQELEIPVGHHALVDANAIGSKAGHFANIDQQTSDGTGKGNKKRKGRAKGQEKSKGAKLKLRQELKRIIQKIMELKIGDDVENREDAGQYQNTPQPQGAEGVLVLYEVKTKKKTKKKPPSVQGVLVPYEAETKKKRPRVELDAETIQRWKQSMLLDDGGARDEADKDNRKWERERGLFRGRVESFLVRMHLILGDRHFTLWKGSVVDSIIGVFLTQNVSDYLSSNAFMSLASKFPIYLVNGEQNGEIADKIQEFHNKLEQIVGKGETVKIQESHNILEQILEQIMGKEEIVGSQGDIKHEKGHAERQASPSAEKKKKGKVVEKKTDPLEWEKLRRTYSSAGPRIADHMDSVDWDAVRRAGIDEIAATIKERGQHNQLAKRIHHFLNELVRKQGSIDLEWLRNCPPDKVKEYLLEVHGLGLKSVECIRLLALQHVAFPVDINVCRIAVRLGWVPLEPLPGNLQIHLLESFPILDEVQKYLWPRLRELDQRTLYELHYHLITFGKVFCTKTKPNCNACPMRGECKHFASAYASARLSLPAPNGENTIVRSNGNGESTAALGAIPLPESGYQTGSCEPIIEEPASPKIASKELLERLLERDIEDFYCDDGDELLTINLSSAKYSRDLQSPINDVGMSEENSRALVALHNFIPMPKLKEVTRLRTEHYVYELPDSHPLLRELPKREVDDPCSYLLLIRTEDEAADSFKSPNGACDSCNEQTFQGESYATIKGTLLIPCRTFLSARFPLNGTYFQVNEVFADHESSHNPIDVPRRWIWNLRRRIVYFGTSASSIFKGLTMEKIQSCFRNGFICIRGIDRKTGAPRPLIPKFHQLAHKAPKSKKST